MPKVSVITGGAGGMGLATARILGTESIVVLCDRSREHLETAGHDLRQAGIDCATVVCDITDPRSVQQLVDQAQKLGTVHAVVHTAGVSPSMGSPETIVRVNAVGTVLIHRAFLHIAHEGLAVINVASVAGHQLPNLLAPKRRYKHSLGDVEQLHASLMALCNRFTPARRAQLAYVLSKNFVIWYSKTMAAQFGVHGARVVSVSPGSFDTAMGRLEETTGAGALAQLGALRRYGRPAEIAALLAFCASNDASYLTGVDIICDGGVTASMTPKAMLTLARPQE
jgi:NAD(P)-dependent dehydrogenase (short-subunit alcohol dehydrogenase family)